MLIQCKLLADDIKTQYPLIDHNKKYLVIALRILLNKGIFVAIENALDNLPVFINLQGFEIISQKIPKNWEIKLIDESGFDYMPKSWMQDNFFKNLKQKQAEAIRLYNKEIEIIYQEE
jgi:hypothetical protein